MWPRWLGPTPGGLATNALCQARILRHVRPFIGGSFARAQVYPHVECVTSRLKRDGISFAHSRGFEVGGAFLWREGFEQLTGRQSEVFDATSSSFTQ